MHDKKDFRFDPVLIYGLIYVSINVEKKNTISE
jgi:hypothetical protein